MLAFMLGLFVWEVRAGDVEAKEELAFLRSPATSGTSTVSFDNDGCIPALSSFSVGYLDVGQAEVFLPVLFPGCGPVANGLSYLHEVCMWSKTPRSTGRRNGRGAGGRSESKKTKTQGQETTKPHGTTSTVSGIWKR
jgi:hypothetical protein